MTTTDEFAIEVTRCSEQSEGQLLIHGTLRGGRLPRREERVQLARTGAVATVVDVASLGQILRQQGAQVADGAEGPVALVVTGWTASSLCEGDVLRPLQPLATTTAEPPPRSPSDLGWQGFVAALGLFFLIFGLWVVLSGEAYDLSVVILSLGLAGLLFLPLLLRVFAVAWRRARGRN
jgi:hypothetical protein